MGRKKLKVVKYYHSSQCDEASPDEKNAILIQFNRRLHPLEAMGIVHLVKEDINDGK